MEQKKEYKLYKRRWVVLLSFVCVNAVMQYGWAFFSSIVTDAWHFYGFQDAASGEAAISALTMIIMGCMIVFSIPASWVPAGCSKKSVGIKPFPSPASY